MAEKKKRKKIDMSYFLVHDYTQEQRGSLYFSSIVWQMAVSVKKDCWDLDILQPW